MTQIDFLQFPATVSKVETKTDYIRLWLDTQVLEPDDMAKIFKFHQNLAHVAIGALPVSLDQIEIPEIETEFKQDKTPSQRLRNTLFVVWEAQGKQGTFDDFYKKKIETLIIYLKEKYLE
jgi:hypothetical protein